MAGKSARFGTVTVVTGPESFLAERAVAQQVAALRAVEPEASLTTVAAESLTLGQLQEMTGADLFAANTIAVITGLEKLPKELAAALVAVAADLPDFVALIVQHGGGVSGKKTLEQLKSGAGLVIDCPALKPRQLADFVRAEAVAAHGSIEAPAAQQLVDAVGHDTRALAAAVDQLLADAETATITSQQVQRYFAGRATITSFAVADDCLAGRTGQALVKLRWALASGTAHVMVTSALANSLRQLGQYLAATRQQPRPRDLASLIGAPSWKVDQIARQARPWSEPAVARAIRVVAQADADIKGAAGDPDYALERAVLTITRLRGQ
ncbi:MAG: DNA polymerase III subunit delta [Propionibacteriaceae bacterium]|jgi:DNA polymerase-3 subunit delta|nr:DNA polymerase III subunit delta [Propionibacteriaceae bacterium]